MNQLEFDSTKGLALPNKIYPKLVSEQLFVGSKPMKWNLFDEINLSSNIKPTVEIQF